MSRTAASVVILVAAALSLASCATAPAPHDDLTFVVVRHAEKAGNDPRDPDLDEAGHARARALATQLRDAPVVAAWSTGYRRTRQTAAPTADHHGLALRTYDAAMPAAEFAALLRREHDHGVVLVVGHSNTVPGIVSALCACPVAEIDERVYGGRYDVRIDGDGRAAVVMGGF